MYAGIARGKIRAHSIILEKGKSFFAIIQAVDKPIKRDVHPTPNKSIKVLEI